MKNMNSPNKPRHIQRKNPTSFQFRYNFGIAKLDSNFPPNHCPPVPFSAHLAIVMNQLKLLYLFQHLRKQYRDALIDTYGEPIVILGERFCQMEQGAPLRRMLQKQLKKIIQNSIAKALSEEKALEEQEIMQAIDELEQEINKGKI